jgi:type I restriction enzyme S subunit
VSVAGVPALRFSEFKEPWQTVQLANDDSIIEGDGDWILSEDISENGSWKIVQLANIGFGEFIYKKMKTISESSFSKIKGTPIYKGDLLINRMVDNNLYVCIHPLDGDYVTAVDVCWIRKSDKFLNSFLVLAMLTKRSQNKLISLSSGSGRVRISKKNFFTDFPISLPSITEQQKLADFLGAVDARVGLLRRRRDALRVYKKGMMQRLFSQKLRFTKPDGSRFPDWQSLPAHQLFSSISNKNHNGDLPILAATQDGGVIPRDQMEMEIQSSAASILSYKIVDVDDFVISLRSFQGGIEHSNFHGICSPAYTVLRSNLSIAPGFYSRFFKTRDFIEKLSSTVVGIRDGKQISFSAFSTLKLPYPHPAEQQKIADTLTALDAKIDAVTAQTEAMLRFKKGLLQQMFV